MSKTSGPGGRNISMLVMGLVAVAGALLGGQQVIQEGGSSSGGSSPGGVSTCPSVPAEAEKVIDTVEKGGPYKYPEDDSRFGNYENVLPKEKLGYYREYTVDTPGVNHRGERRIVTGGGADGKVDEWYYTGDHYESFCEVPR